MMMQTETGNKDIGRINKLERSASFSSPNSYNSDDIMGKSSNQAFSAIIKESKMQASFAERTASEMEEIVSWYKQYEGIERLQKHNQQSQSMPDNAMIVVDDDDRDDFEEENDGSNNTTYGIRCADQQEDQQQKLQVGDEDYVTVKDYCTPAQRELTTKPMTSSKKAASYLFSAVRYISQVRKFDDPPPRAIQILVEDEDGSVISSLSPQYNADDSMKGVNQSIVDAVSGDLIRDSENLEEIVAFCDEEEEVLAMLSLSGCAELKAQTLIENTDDYNDKEQEVLELLSPSSCSSNSFFGSSPTGKSNEVQSNDSGDSISTGQEAQSQIKAAADLIRNTQNMAEIILQLQQSSLASVNYDGGDDDDDIVNICNNNVDLDDNSIDASSTFDSAKIASKNTKPNAIEIKFSGFQVQQFYQFIVPVLLSLVIGLVLKFIKP
jgi:hypothetical protein